MKKSELVSIILDYSFALLSIESFLQDRQIYSGSKTKVILTDKEKIQNVLEYIKSDKYKEVKELYEKFHLERINDKLFSVREVKNKYYLRKRIVKLNK